MALFFILVPIGEAHSLISHLITEDLDTKGDLLNNSGAITGRSQYQCLDHQPRHHLSGTSPPRPPLAERT